MGQLLGQSAFSQFLSQSREGKVLGVKDGSQHDLIGQLCLFFYSLDLIDFFINLLNLSKLQILGSQYRLLMYKICQTGLHLVNIPRILR